MPRFHFNVHDGSELHDAEGCELTDIAAARQAAVRLSGDLLRDDKDFWNQGEWRMEVTDASGLILFTLLFIGIDAPAAPPRPLILRGDRA